MKKNIIVACLISAFTLTGCMDNFLERNPFGSIDETTFFTEEEHANLAAIACYANLQRLNGHWGEAQLELGMTGDFSSAGFKDAQPFYGGTFNPNESNLVLGIWKRGYAGIAVCNKNIEGVTAMDDKLITTEKRNQYLAEMKFIRAFWYFRLIQFYGDIPLRSASVDDPTNPNQVELAATPKEQILSNIIIPDFEFASQNLPDQWDDAYAHRATKGAAYAYLCEAYLYIKQYEKAILAGQSVEKFNYELLADPGRVLHIEEENSKELIFSVGIAEGISGFERELYFGTIEDLGTELGRVMRGDSYSGDYFYPSKEMVDFYQTIDGKLVNEGSAYFDASAPWKNRDPRFDTTFFTEMDDIVTTKGKEVKWSNDWLVNDATGFDIQKRGVWYGEENWNTRADIHLMRLPRVYLHMAEAYALQTQPNFTKCAEYIEKVRSRARQYAYDNRDKYIPSGLEDIDVLPPFSITSIESAMEAINYESRVEFFAEDCIRYFDLKRWGKLDEEWSRVGEFTWEDKLFDLPFPASELSSNSQLTQHDGWGS